MFIILEPVSFPHTAKEQLILQMTIKQEKCQTDETNLRIYSSESSLISLSYGWRCGV